jgi:NagD protein
VLVLTGSIGRSGLEHFPYRPTRVVDSIAEVVPLVDEYSRRCQPMTS